MLRLLPRAAALFSMTLIVGASAASMPAHAAPVYWGGIINGRAPEASAFATGGAYDTFEQKAGKKMSMIQWGQPWKMNGTMQPFQRAYFDNVRAHGSIPVLNWAPWELGKGAVQPDFQLRDITAGTYDSYVRNWASAAKSWGHPLMLRFGHEMNGWWYPWGEGTTSTGTIVNGNARGDYAAAWRHVHDIFRSVGATNVSWMWSPNYMSTSSRYPALSGLYPGDGYVDWSGLSIYNVDKSNWLGAASLLTGAGTNYLANSYERVLAVAPNKPMALAEVGSREYGDDGTRKAEWITDLLAVQIPLKFPAIRAFLWFNWSDVGFETVPVESSVKSQAAFTAAVASSTYVANNFASLSVSPIPAPGSSTRTLTPVADTFTTSAAPSSTAGGTAARLEADRDPVANTFLKFDLTGVPASDVGSVTLRVRTTADSYAGSSVAQDVFYVADSAWKEAYMSHSNTVPISTTRLGGLPAGTQPGAWYDVPLAPQLVRDRAGKLLSVAIRGGGADGFFLASRETASDPQLVINR